MEINEHWLIPARQIASPNCSERPATEEISLLVIHNISLPPGEYGGAFIDELFCNQLDCSAHPYFTGLKELKVSAHLLINRAGDVTQYVPFNLKANHAGESSFAGRSQCNDFSIGIELEGTDDEPFTEQQYQALAEVSTLLLLNYPAITAERITGHSEISPGRKTDPGPCFDWHHYRDLITG